MSTESDSLGYPRPAQGPRGRPFVGGYYWLPTPSLDAAGGVDWSVVSCRDLGCDAGAGHDAELWPRLMVPLAAAWGRDARILRRRLALCYTGLPRGRLSRPAGTFLVFHGDDAPIRTWKELVVEEFRLSGRKMRFVFDEHETMIPGHPRAVENALGARLYGLGS